MLPPIIESLLAQITPEQRIYNDLSSDIIVRIRKTMTDHHITQAELAQRLGKRPSEIHKLLSFGHNLTLQTIAKLSAALGENLIQVPKSGEHLSTPASVTYKVLPLTSSNLQRHQSPRNTGTAKPASSRYPSFDHATAHQAA